jgi:hypothetical protein
VPFVRAITYATAALLLVLGLALLGATMDGGMLMR